MPYTFTHLPPPIDKRKMSNYKSASDFTSAASTNAVASFISTNGVLSSVKKAMQAGKGGNYNLDLIKFKAAYRSPTTQVFTLTSSGSYDTFIAQYNSTGSVNWVARIGGAESEQPIGITTDSNGNITVTGYFDSTTTIYDKNGNPFATTLTNDGTFTTFIAQYSSAGLVNWVARIGGTGRSLARGVTVDLNGNITVTGYFGLTTTVYDKNGDPFATTLSASSVYDVFIAQYSSTGNVNWVARIAGTDSDYYLDSSPSRISTDSNGNITVTGIFISSTLTIYDKNGDPFATTLTNDGSYDVFIAQYSSAGLVNWVARIAGTSADYASDLSTDLNGNITVVGYFAGTTTVYDKNGDPFATTLTSITNDYDIYIAQYSSAGLVNWVGQIAGAQFERSSSVVTDSNGNITVTGIFQSSTLGIYDKNRVSFATSLSNAGSNDIFIAQYSSAGLVNWVARIAGTGNDIPEGSITVDSNGNITVTGYFNSSTLTIYDKNGNPFATTLTKVGSWDTFIVQYSSVGLVNWVKQITGTGGAYGNGVTSDSNGNITVIGDFNLTVTIQ